MKKVNITFIDVFEDGKTFEDCLNNLLDTYYTTEGAEAPSNFFIFRLSLYPTFDIIGKISLLIAMFAKVEWEVIPHTNSISINDLECKIEIRK